MDRFQAAVDIKANRLAAKFNRLDSAYLAEWRRDYTTARNDYIRGDISRLQFGECLEALGFRSDALKVEILDAERDKRNPSYKPPFRTFRYAILRTDR